MNALCDLFCHNDCIIWVIIAILVVLALTSQGTTFGCGCGCH